MSIINELRKPRKSELTKLYLIIYSGLTLNMLITTAAPPKSTICMICQILFSRKMSAESAHTVLKVKYVFGVNMVYIIDCHI